MKTYFFLEYESSLKLGLTLQFFSTPCFLLSFALCKIYAVLGERATRCVTFDINFTCDGNSHRRTRQLIDTLLVWFEHKFGDFEKCSAEYAESVKEKLIGYLISILKAALCSSTFRTDVQRCMRLALYISDPKTEEQTRELSQVFLQLIRLTCVQPRILSRLLKILPKASASRVKCTTT